MPAGSYEAALLGLRQYFVQPAPVYLDIANAPFASADY